MDLLNLNIEAYNDRELEEMLSLTYPYREEDIVLQKNDLYKKLIDDNSVDMGTKDKITDFLNKIAHRLEKIISKGIILSGGERYHFEDLKNTVKEVNNHFLIVKEEEKKEAYKAKLTDGLNIGDQGGAPPGIINPINYRTIKRAVNIDSKFRPDYYQTSSADQRLTLPYRFEKVINMRLASLELPLTYFAISEGQENNSLVVEWDTSVSPDTYENKALVKIPDGNYHTFVTESSNGEGGSIIESVLNGALLSSTALTNSSGVYNGVTLQSDASFNLRYTVDSTSGRSVFALDVSGIPIPDLTTLIDDRKLAYKITFGVDTNGNTVYNQPLPFFLGWQLGYRIIEYISGPGSTSGGIIKLPASIVSEGICYIKGPSYIFLAVDDFNNNVNNYYVSAYSDSINNKNILARINLSSIMQNNGFFKTGEDDGFSTQVNRSRNYFGPVNIERLRVTLYDEYGRILNLNNMDWSCALMFECMYS